jgi:membrane protease YdiL (CAAX protease family)
VTTAVFVVFIAVTDHDLPVDRGDDVFDRAAAIWEWSDQRIKAAVEGTDLPEAPRIWADLTSLKAGLATSLVFEVSLVAVAAIAAGQADFRELRQTFALNRFSVESLWLPALAMVAAYLSFIAYTVIVTALGIDILKPESNVPVAVTRDDLAMAMAGVLACVAAPVAEEIFYRGFLFRGLLRWGFLPAAAASGFVFAAAHLTLGALIPFFIIGFMMAWVYWRRGRLWDTIVFHFLFNATSFAFLAAGVAEGG